MQRIILIIMALLTFSCRQENLSLTKEEVLEIYEQKGVMPPEYFKPIIKKLKKPLYGIYEIDKESSFISRNKKREY